MSLLQTLANNVNAEFKAALPAINQVITDMIQNAEAWQANPVVKATEAAVAIVSPVAALDIAAVVGAASLVQALWQVYGSVPAQPAQSVPPAAPTTTPVAAVASSETAIPLVVDSQPSHM